jgi:uncharacterized membrane protein YbhN (UPF0104 family)
MRRLLSFLAKVAVSALLLYLSLRSVNVGVVVERINQLNAGWLFFILIVLMVQTALLAVRWRQIVLVSGANLSLSAALRYSLIATFFNQTLPSTIGGDAARVWLLGRSGAGWRLAGYSVLIDRGVGLFALAILVVVCLPWSLALVRDPVGSAALVVIGFSSIVGALIFTAITFAPKRVMNRWWLTRHLAATAGIAWRLCLSPGSAASVGVLSIAIQFLTVTAVWGAAQSINAPLEFPFALFLVPPVMLIAAIPISIAGWGLREGTMIVAFAYAGLSPDNGLVVSVLFGAASFIVGALGGIFWIASGERLSPPPENVGV